jgi:hypothetical protein
MIFRIGLFIGRSRSSFFLLLLLSFFFFFLLLSSFFFFLLLLLLSFRCFEFSRALVDAYDAYSPTILVRFYLLCFFLPFVPSTTATSERFEELFQAEDREVSEAHQTGASTLQ